MQMNLQLTQVVSDITGQTGLRIIRDIVAGRRDPQQLAQHRDRRCHASVDQLTAALTGDYRDEHVFALQQHLALFDACHTQLAACDDAMRSRCNSTHPHREPPRRCRRAGHHRTERRQEPP